VYNHFQARLISQPITGLPLIASPIPVTGQGGRQIHLQSAKRRLHSGYLDRSLRATRNQMH
jgi:hypothetical protein